jgi:hypothetical protein
MMPQKIAAGNEKLPANFGNSNPTGRRTFYLASPRALRNNFRVKNKILLLAAAIGLMFISGCVSIG